VSLNVSKEFGNLLEKSAPRPDAEQEETRQAVQLQRDSAGCPPSSEMGETRIEGLAEKDA
jgi:hypothetical protein